MVATRNLVQVTARCKDGAGFCRVERRSYGSAKNLQRQCSTGELEFDPAKKVFVVVKKDARRPFKVEEVQDTGQTFSYREQTKG